MNRTTRAHIDWEDVGRRLASSERAMQAASQPDADRINAVFRERAGRMARHTGDVEQGGKGCLLLIFELGGERFAVQLEHVAEVARMPRCTPVPGGPPAMVGVMNHRGTVRSVFDLARLLGISEAEDLESGNLLVLENGNRQTPVRVDRVEQVQQLDLCAFVAPPALKSVSASACVAGVHPDGIALLSVDAVCDHLNNGTIDDRSQANGAGLDDRSAKQLRQEVKS